MTPGLFVRRVGVIGTIGEEGVEETYIEGVRRDEDGVVKVVAGFWWDDGVAGGLKVPVPGDCVMGELCLKITKRCLPGFVQT
jgi:hypothetical protein